MKSRKALLLPDYQITVKKIDLVITETKIKHTHTHTHKREILKVPSHFHNVGVRFLVLLFHNTAKDLKGIDGSAGQRLCLYFLWEVP